MSSTTTWTVSPAAQPAPLRATVSPGAYDVLSVPTDGASVAKAPLTRNAPNAHTSTTTNSQSRRRRTPALAYAAVTPTPLPLRSPDRAMPGQNLRRRRPGVNRTHDQSELAPLFGPFAG